MAIDREDVMRLTIQHGGEWGIQHTRRLLILVDLIGEGLDYDHETIWLAAHLHDWGAYGGFAQPGIDHVVRSLQVVERYLSDNNCPSELKARLLECIEFHHSAHPGLAIETILLADADALDFLGVVGVLRDFSKSSKQLRKAFQTSEQRRIDIPAKLCLEKSRQVAAGRLQFMDEIFKRFEAETFGCF